MDGPQMLPGPCSCCHGGGKVAAAGARNSRGPARLRSIALLDKPTRREVDFRADWIGFEIPDEFVVGYGIDYAQRNRNLPHIGKVRFVDE